MKIRKFVVSSAIATALVAMSVGPAFADGNGYAPPGGTITTTTNAGFTTVVSAQTVSSSGATLTGTANGSSVTVSVPSGAFSTPEQISLTSGNPTQVASDAPSGDTVLAAFGINFTGSAPKVPITVTISNASIPAGALVYKVTTNGLVQVHATVTAGKAVISFSSDPNFVVVAPKGNTVAGATTPVTGLPLENELGTGLGIAILGAALTVYALRKKRAH